MKYYFLSFFFVASVCFADGSDWADSDSGIFGPKYQEILANIQALQSQYPDRTRLIDYGASIEGRPLKMLLLYQSSKPFKNRPTLYMTGSIHGNEYLNIEDRLPKTLVEKSLTAGVIKTFVDAGGVFVFVPIVNPDGYDRRQRVNANGVDLNRDWDVVPANFIGFKEVETKRLSQKLLSLKSDLNLNYRVMVDYHCCIGALLHPWSYLEENIMNAEDLVAHQAIGQLAKTNLGSSIEVGTTGKVLGYYPLGTTKDYFYDTYGALSFTYEGRYAKENDYLEGHVRWWEGITQHILREKIRSPLEDPLTRLQLS